VLNVDFQFAQDAAQNAQGAVVRADQE
jgi:hypothetical protein